jgi:ribosome biogenesis GTPase A
MDNQNLDEKFNTILEYVKLNHSALELLWKKIDLLEKEVVEDMKTNSKKKKTILSDEEKKKRKERWDKMVEEEREEHPNAWKSWNESQDEELLILYNSGMSITNITKMMGRSYISIIKRLAKKGIIIEDGENE